MSLPHFNEEECLKKLRKYLPAQAPLKDFVHHNTLHAFQDQDFEDALRTASRMFGYKVTLSIDEYRELYKNHKIREDVLEDRIIKKKGVESADEWVYKLFHQRYDDSHKSRIGSLRRKWARVYDVDLIASVKNPLFKILNAYLDQGISIWTFPEVSNGFLESVRMVESNSFTSFFRTKKARKLLKDESITIKDLLDILVADEEIYERYIFDQQFSHPGWSGMVAFVERNPHSLMDVRKITLQDLIIFELILEIDALESYYFGKWKPLSRLTKVYPLGLFEPVAYKEKHDVISLWHEAYEWSYYDEVLAGITKMKGKNSRKANCTFQAMFCIDDRESSIRRHIESLDRNCETYGTPGHFGIPTFYKPKQGKFYTRVCPGSIEPKHLIKELGTESKLGKEIHLSKATHHPFYGTIGSTVLGYFSAFKLMLNIFKPTASPVASVSFKHMNDESVLSVNHEDHLEHEDGLQVGFTLDERKEIVRSVLQSIGLIDNFSLLVYVIGHGGSSINNTHYAGYDCGACSGRPGSVNARAFCQMANNSEVRKALISDGISIPKETVFVGGLHDTTRDEIAFFDESKLSDKLAEKHLINAANFHLALQKNAKERARWFLDTNLSQNASKIHEDVKKRSVSLFEPRPELNHSGNALCIVGRHSLNEGLFLDSRAFSNSYDYSLDLEGVLLKGILNAATPVCGGINLEYYFSTIDNDKFGAGSKLPHNVMGLIGVANGVEGDLRTGLPLQMIEVHDPIRIMIIVEHYPEVVEQVIKSNTKTYEWYYNRWVHLVVVHPETYELFTFEKGNFSEYKPLKHLLDTTYDVDELITKTTDYINVHLIGS